MFPTREGGRCSPLIAPSHYFAFKSEESDESEAISHAIPIPCGEMRKKSGEQLLLVCRLLHLSAFRELSLVANRIKMASEEDIYLI